MKKLIQQIVLSGILVMLISSTAFSANEYFRSVTSGNWNVNGTWQMSTDAGGTWIAATKTPNDTSGVITIQSPNTVTVTVSVNADQLVVNGGGIISINNLIILTIKDGSGVDLTLNSGGVISGSGTLQTQGNSVSLDIHNGSNFNTSLKINSGAVVTYDSGAPYTATFNGTITIDTGTTFSVNGGGYYVRANNTVTNNGIINGSGAYFKMYGASLINNDTIRSTYFELDSTTSLSGTGVITSSYVTVGSSGNVSLANNVTFSPAISMTVVSGGVLNPNTRTLTFISSSFAINSGGTIPNSGIFQTQNLVNLVIRNGSNFSVPLKVNTGTTTTFDDGAPYNAKLNGTITIDAGAIMQVRDGGYFTQANNNVTNNGTISGNSSVFYVRSSTFINNGSINVTALEFDTTTSVVGTGTYTGNTILISNSGNVTLTNNVTFSPVISFTILSGGIFYPGSKTFTFTSGTFVLNSGATVSGTGVNAGTMQTQGNVNFDFRNGSVFNSAVKVNTGTLNAYADGPPYKATFYGAITIDAGATLHTVDGGYFIQANNTVTNSGSITGSSSSFIMKGSSLINNGLISLTYLNLDTTTSLSGTGTYTSSNITIGSTGNISLANNVIFTPVNFVIISGGILNPNARIFTLNSGIFILNSGATISNSGTFQTQGTVSMIIKNGSGFNAPLKINSGTNTSYDNGPPFTAKFNGTVTIDAGAVLNVLAGGYFIQTNSSVTNNGTITASSSSTLLVRSSSFVNNGAVGVYNLEFDTTTVLSGTGTYTGVNTLIAGSGSVSLANNLIFSPSSTFTINSGGTLNPNTFTFTLSTAIFTLSSSATVSNSGLFQTQGTISTIIKNGSNFNAPLKVISGVNTAYDNGSPFMAIFNGPISVDAGATFTMAGGGYFLRANGTITNNGTISGSGSTFRFFGSNFTNNGSVFASVFNFESVSQTLQGTGSWGINPNILSGSTVTLGSNHQMNGLNINSGGAFNLSAFKLSVAASNPISNSGTFNTSTGTVEYNGVSAQSISTTAITYNKLRINNTAGVSLPAALTVNDTLSVILGDLNLNGQILTISPTGYLTETAGNTVTGTSGYLTTTRSLNAPSALNVGGLGAVLTTAVNMGSTEIRRGHAVQNGLNGNTSILRYFDITPTTNTGLNATLVFKYDDTELNGKVESALGLYKSTNTGTSWTSQGGTVNTSSNTVTLAALGSFSRWSASSTSAVASQIKVITQGLYNTGTGTLNKRDTIRAYIRNATAPYALIDSAKSAIDVTTFTGSFLFSNTPTGTYYIQLKSRNMIETWSKSGGTAYTLGAVLSYDFTNDSSKAFGNNMKKISTKWTIYAGDVNQDMTVDASDVSDEENDAFNSVSGYVPTDITGDDFVDAEDVSIVENNSIAGVNVISP